MFEVKSLKQKQFKVILFTEVWERFAFYGLQALFILFIARSKSFPSNIQPYMLYGIFTALLYVMPTIGGYCADRYFGIKRSLILGAFSLSMGYGLLAWANEYEIILVALALIVIGNGFFKPTPAALISLMSEGKANESKRLFTLYYMSINLGSLLALIFIPKVASYYSFHFAFFLSMLGMLLGLINFLYRLSWFKTLHNEADEKPLGILLSTTMIGFVVVATGMNFILLHYPNVAFYLVLVAGWIVFMYLLLLNKDKESVQARFRHRIGIILLFETIMFWIVYLQMFSTVILFIKHNVNLMLLGYTLSPGNLMAFNTLAILFLAPLIAMLYKWLAKKQWSVTVPYKFAMGVIFSGLSVLVLPAACLWFSVNSQINLFWIAASLTIFAIGELLVSALGLSMVSLYFPKRINTFAMGVFFITVAIAGALTGKIAELFATVPENISAEKSLAIYIHYFSWLGLGTVLLGFGYVMIAYFIGVMAKRKSFVLH